MSTTPDNTIVLLGLVSTGKTNFLVALDVVLDDQKDPDGLVHHEFAVDRTYLQGLKELWLLAKEFERTDRLQPPPPHPLIVRYPKNGAVTGFHLPDLAGETFDAQFETRSFTTEFASRIQNAGGLLLFIHSGHDADHTLLQSPIFMDPAPTSPPSVSTSATPAPSPASEPVKEWTLKNASRQTKLVDLLQFISDLRTRKNPLRIAIALSAWDLVESAPAPARSELPQEPLRFLSARWPLLDQYLRAQKGLFDFRVYGVSARGGGNANADIDRLTNMARPIERISILDDTHRSRDLSRPVRWLLKIDDGTTPPHA